MKTNSSGYHKREEREGQRDRETDTGESSWVVRH